MDKESVHILNAIIVCALGGEGTPRPYEHSFLTLQMLVEGGGSTWPAPPPPLATLRPALTPSNPAIFHRSSRAPRPPEILRPEEGAGGLSHSVMEEGGT
jgi:hypothetical protein